AFGALTCRVPPAGRRGAAAALLPPDVRKACRRGSRRTGGTRSLPRPGRSSWRSSYWRGARSWGAVLCEQAVEAGDLVHEIVEAAIGGGQFAQGPHQHGAGPARPQEQRQMRQVAALGDGPGQIVHLKSSISSFLAVEAE